MGKLKQTLMKGLAFLLVFCLVLGIPVYARADYNTATNGGVVVVAFYVKGAFTCYIRPSNGKPVTQSNGNYYGKNLGDTIWSTGSGFFIGKENEAPQYLATNCHVVDDFIAAKNGESGFLNTNYTEQIKFADGTTENCQILLGFTSCELRVYYDEDDFEEAFVVDAGSAETSVNAKLDLAILKLNKPTTKRHSLKLHVADQNDIGKTVYTVGYPGNSDNLLTSASKWGMEDVTVSKGSISRFATSSGTGVQTIQTDANIQHGNSGGPLIDDKYGAVIGINTWGITKGTETSNYSINVSELIEMLDKNNVPYEMAKVKGKFNPLFVIIPAVVVIAAVVVIIIAVNAKKGKNKKQIVGYDPTTGKPIYATPQPQPQAPVQPQYQQPQAPAQPQYQQPQAPAQPQYQQPQAPVQPQYQQPQAPVQPQYQQPQAPVQPQYQQPQAPVQPQYQQPQTPAQQLYPGQPQYQPPVQPQYQQPQAPNGQQYQPPQQ